ncbi:MAG: type II toxin-antitoxin system PemK/MazF family toxin [archaeon]|jgi:mRNA interferase MazF|nr:type II toxin-antitoxin system PemK/MazF family toxin [archaeon]
MNSLSFEQGDIVIAQLLFSEQIGLKIRPALVISNTKYNKENDGIILLKITSAGKKTKYNLTLIEEDMQIGKLKQESTIMVDNPVTTYKGMIQTKAGKITKEKLNQVKEKMAELYEIKTKDDLNRDLKKHS